MRRVRTDREPAPQNRPNGFKKAPTPVQLVSAQTAAATPHTNTIIHLQQTVGNQAVQRLLAEKRISQAPPHGIVARQCDCAGTAAWAPSRLQREDELDNTNDDVSEDVIGDNALGDSVVGDAAADNAGGSDLVAQADDSLLDVANLGQLGNIFSDATASCTPASSALRAKAMHQAVRASWLTFSSSVFGSETTSVWDNYLDSSLPLPRPTRNFVGSGEVVSGFTKHHKSAEAEKEIVTTAGKALSGSVSLPAPGATTSIPVTSAISAAILRKRLNDKTDPMGLDYDSPASTIPGNLAGGIGAGGAPGNTVALDPDTRDVDGSLQLTRDNTGASLTITPQLTFKVHDTVDFCPGNLGGLIARAETVPMSILEATEARFGPVFAADVPLNVSYPGSGVPQTVPVSKPTP